MEEASLRVSQNGHLETLDRMTLAGFSIRRIIVAIRPVRPGRVTRWPRPPPRSGEPILHELRAPRRPWCSYQA